MVLFAIIRVLLITVASFCAAEIANAAGVNQGYGYGFVVSLAFFTYAAVLEDKLERY